MRRTTVVSLVAVTAVVALGLGFSGWFGHHPTAQIVVASSPASGKAVVSGTLVMVGGPPPGPRIPVPGRVAVANIEEVGSVLPDIDVGTDGTFSVVVDPGTYEVSGTSPNYNGGRGTCTARPQTVSVQAGERAVVDVQCQMR